MEKLCGVYSDVMSTHLDSVRLMDRTVCLIIRAGMNISGSVIKKPLCLLFSIKSVNSICVAEGVFLTKV